MKTGLSHARRRGYVHRACGWWLLILGGVRVLWGADPVVSEGNWLQPEHLQVLNCSAPREDLHFLEANQPGNLWHPEEKVDLTVRFLPGAGLVKTVEVEVVEIGTEANRLLERTNAVGTARYPALENLGIRGRKTYAIAEHFVEGATNEVKLEDVPVPARLGTYAVTVAPDAGSARFLATVARVLPPEMAGAGGAPVLADGTYLTGDRLETRWLRERTAALARLGVDRVRVQFGWNEEVPGRYDWRGYDRVMETLAEAGIKAMVTMNGHPAWSMPFGEPTPAVLGAHPDLSCRPEYRDVFGIYVSRFCARYWNSGSGGLWAIEHWNEPWEGISVSGWQSDANHYRALMEELARGARRVDPRIRTAAAGSIMNTELKFLTGDQPEESLRWLDLFTDHYVPPESCYGPMVAKYWGKESVETEAWVAANEVIMGQVMLQLLACGQTHVSPWHASMVAFGVPGSPMKYQMPTPVAAATAAFNALVGGRRFQGLLFRSHLPWAFRFGEGNSAVVVVTGQLLPIGRKGAEGVVWRQALEAPPGQLTIDNTDGALEFFDMMGNPAFEGVPAPKIHGDTKLHFVRARRGGEELLRKRFEVARLEGFRAVEIVVHDLTRVPEAQEANVRVTLHNLLNRGLIGRLRLTAGPGLVLETGERSIHLGAGEIRDFQFPIQSRLADPANVYEVEATFESDSGGASLRERLHDVVVRRARIDLDGKLDDWVRIPAIVLGKGEVGMGGLEGTFDALRSAHTNAFLGEFRMAWDDRFLYVAVRVQDPTPSAPHQRLEDWNEEQYFRGAEDDAICEQLRPYERLVLRLPADRKDWVTMEKDPEWPGLHRMLTANQAALLAVESQAAKVYFRARKRDPSASFASASHVYRKLPWDDRPYAGDTLQIGLDLIPGLEHHRIASDADRVPEGFHAIPDTDYEFCAYACVDGGTEVWRYLAPGVPRSHPAPRQKWAKVDQGAVTGADCVVVRSGTLLIYELAIPWKEFAPWAPRVGESFGCVVRFNDETQSPLTFGEGKSATKANSLTLHPYHDASPSCGVRWVLGGPM